jgi:catechol 2,3-dioxygenase-like lactoylglutathione lyase family enzyme
MGKMFSRIQHAGYLVEDLEAAVAWYEKTFGGKRTGGGAAAMGQLAFVRIGDVEVELIQPVDRSGLTGRGDHVFHHVGYVVDDLDKAVAGYKAKGYTFATSKPMVNVAGYRLIFFDTSCTNGMRIHLTEARSLPW